ncbi:MAG: hypothetical protein U0T84_06560 [Chitinophagales bacterium]
MKKLLLAAALLPLLATAQKEINVEPQDKENSQGTKPAFVMVIPQNSMKDVMDDWKKFIKKDSKGKIEEVKGELKLVGAVNTNITPNPFTIVSKMVETPEGVQLTAWFTDGDVDIAPKTDPDKSVAIQKMMHDFGVSEYKAAVKKEVEKAVSQQNSFQKTFDGFVKDQKTAEDRITSHKRDIEELQKKIKNEEENIVKAKDMQTKSKADLDKQIEAVKAVNEKLNNIK